MMGHEHPNNEQPRRAMCSLRCFHQIGRPSGDWFKSDRICAEAHEYSRLRSGHVLNRKQVGPQRFAHNGAMAAMLREKQQLQLNGSAPNMPWLRDAALSVKAQLDSAQHYCWATNRH